MAARLVKAQDLGEAPAEESVHDEPVAERIALVRTQTQASGKSLDVERSSKDGIDYNLVKCAYILLKEQGPILWKCFVLLGLATIVGGEEVT
jgi:ATP-binding cassette subfamily B (MDR/TAP) protein 1